MLWSKLFIPTLRENPAEAEGAVHQLLLRAGYVRQVAAGIYSHLFLAQRSLLKIAGMVREEMDRMGAQEMRLPALNPAELWRESGRWDIVGDTMFRLKDRLGRELCLGRTHEEVITVTARGELRSYKQLPQIWYQIQTKFRDEPRSNAGLLGARQFLMADSYSFDMNAEGLESAYRKHYDAYRRILGRSGLEYLIADAHAGAAGGQAQEFVVELEAGEGLMVMCRQCGYAANRETAAAQPGAPAAADPEEDLAPAEFHTPGRKTIAEVSAFTGLPETAQMKSLVLVAHGRPLLVLLRGDHQLSAAKFAAASGDTAFRPARPEEIREAFGADPGSLGPVGVTRLRILADRALAGRRNMIAGANRDDYHLRHVTPGEDFPAEFMDLRQVEVGDGCMRCGTPVEIRRTLEIAHISKLGDPCAASMGLHVTNAAGTEVTPLMGSYGMGIERILCAAIELYHDQDGMRLPPAIAPFTVVVTPVNMADAAQKEAAGEIYRACLDLGLDALLDDRDERPGVKFKDADLIGVPFRITVGKKVNSGVVELVERRTKKVVDVPVAKAARQVAERTRGDHGD